MKLAHLNARLAVSPPAGPVAGTLYRIQLSTPRATTLNYGGVYVAPGGLMACRYDLPATAVAYFTFDEATAMYETFARREAAFIPLAQLGLRSLLTVSFSGAGLNIANLRLHTGD